MDERTWAVLVSVPCGSGVLSELVAMGSTLTEAADAGRKRTRAAKRRGRRLRAEVVNAARLGLRNARAYDTTAQKVARRVLGELQEEPDAFDARGAGRIPSPTDLLTLGWLASERRQEAWLELTSPRMRDTTRRRLAGALALGMPAATGLLVHRRVWPAAWTPRLEGTPEGNRGTRPPTAATACWVLARRVDTGRYPTAGDSPKTANDPGRAESKRCRER